MGELREDLKKLFNENIDNFVCLPEKCPQGVASMCEDCAADYLSSRLSLDEEKIKKILVGYGVIFGRLKIAKAIASAGVIRIKDK